MNYTVQETKEEIKNGIRGYLRKDEKGAYKCHVFYRLPFYLEGKPGIGKTQIVKQVAEELGIGFVSFSITHHTRSTLLGLPVIRDIEGGKYTEYTMSEIIASVVERERQGEKEGILLLDEFNCASETIMPAMLAFLQTRNIGRFRLPDGWSLVLCGNPKEYNESARNFGPAILDRVRRMTIEPSFEEYAKYAAASDFHPIVVAYLNIYHENMYFCQKNKNDYQVVTCRSWENLSHALYAYLDLDQPVDEKMISQFLKDDEIAHSFYRFYWMWRHEFDDKTVTDIIEGRNLEQNVESINRRDLFFKKNTLKVIVSALVKIKKELAEDPAEDPAGYQHLLGGISHAFRFYRKLEGGFSESLFLAINGTELLDVLADMENEEYLEECQKFYHIPDDIAKF